MVYQWFKFRMMDLFDLQVTERTAKASFYLALNLQN